MACSTCGKKSTAPKQTTVVKQPSVKIYSLADLRKMQIKKT